MKSNVFHRRIIPAQHIDALEFHRGQLAHTRPSLLISPPRYSFSQFPVHVFTPQMREFALELTDTLGASIDVVGTVILGALFTAIRGKAQCKVNNDWHELCTEYFLIESPSGTNKTTIVKLLRRPFDLYLEKQVREFQASAPYMEEQRVNLLSMKKQIRADLKRKLKDVSISECVRLSDEAARKVVAIEKQLLDEAFEPRLFADSTTMKALVKLIKKHGFIALFDAEPSILKNNRMTSNNNIIILKSYFRELYSEDNAEESITIVPTLVITLLVQESIFEKFIENKDYRMDGTHARFLFVRAPKLYGLFASSEPKELSEQCYKFYIDKITSLLELEPPKKVNGAKDDSEICDIELSEEAHKKLRELKAQVDDAIARGHFNFFESFGEKFVGHAIRLAQALHSEKHDNPYDCKIDYQTMCGAIEVADFYFHQAEAIFNQQSDIDFEIAKKILYQIDKNGLWVFFRRDMHNSVSSRYKVDQIQRALNYLEHHGYIRQVNLEGTVYYVVNPYIDYSAVL